MDDEAKGIKHEFGTKIVKGPSLDIRGAINTNKERNEKGISFEVYKVKGQALAPYEAMGHKIVQFLEQSYRIRITKIVLDFITDNNNITYLFNCKYIKIVERIWYIQ